MNPCDFCASPDKFTVTYDLTNFCCAVRYMSNTPAIRVEGMYLALAKHHDVAALRAGVESRKEI